MKTFSAKKEEVERKWFVIDAADQIVGHVAEKAAVLLRGKHKPIYTPHVDCGDHVIVINAAKARFSGKKELQKEYHSFSGYVGGHHSTNPAKLRQTFPERLIEKAVKGMIPHNRLGSQIYGKLHVYAGPEHKQEAQKPEPISI